MILKTLNVLPALLTCLLSTGCAWMPIAHAANYGNHIAIPQDADEALQDSTSDAAVTLQKMTGAAFAVDSEYSGSGVFLLRSDASSAPADAVRQLKAYGREPFVIRSDDDRNLWIVANKDEGLQHGLYFYLEQLGARFYFPNDNWTIIPKRDDIALKIDRLVAPEFRMRTFFGTGGFGPPSPLDPHLEMRERWATWQRRNRFGGEYTLGGHSGEAFNLANKDVLLQHPDYLAKVDGQYVPWSPGAKLNTANPDAVKLYVDWTVERFRRAREANPDDPATYAVSVDPSDGGGHCNSPECQAIGNGSASDQTFYIANQAARAVRAAFPDAYVNLYAYNEHAAVPSIALEPNVLVTVVPYAFQRTGLSADELIAAWGRKVSRLDIYDYWSIPDWTNDLPDFNFLSTPAEKLRFWRQNHIEGFAVESTYSAGAMGLGWYVASRLMWDSHADEQAIIKEFYEKAFGPAAAPMQRMMERWAKGFDLIEPELALSSRDMEEAIHLAQGNTAVLARLADYARYLYYLRLRHDWLVADDAHQSQAYADLLRGIWRIYDSAMIHSFRIFQLMARSDEKMQRFYDVDDKAAEGWKGLTQMTDAEALQSVADGAKQLQLIPDFTPRHYSGKLVPLPKDVEAIPAEMAPDQAPPWNSLFLLGDTELEFYAPPALKAFPLKVSSVDPTRLQLLDSAGKILGDTETEGIEPDAWPRPAPSWEEFELAIPAAGFYRLEVRPGNGKLVRLLPPPGVRLIMRGFLTTKPLASPRLYFYVPKGQKTIAMIVLPLPKEMQPRLWDADGRLVESTVLEGGSLMISHVPDGQDGKVWAIDNVLAPNGPLRFLNVPQVFAFYPDTLLVPQDAL
jgi:hypothetical protein